MLVDDSGNMVNAAFSIEVEEGGLALVLESAGGRTAGGGVRNADYRAALELLLRRLADLRAVLHEALVDSKQARKLTEVERRLLAGPLPLVPELDFRGLRLALTSAQGTIGQRAGAPKPGNNSKRIRLRFEVPGYGIDDRERVERHLAQGYRDSHDTAWTTGRLDASGLLRSFGTLRTHRDAPLHKPLSLVWAIAQVGRGHGRLFRWREFEKPVADLLGAFGAGRTSKYPFWHLGSTPELWEVHGLTKEPGARDGDAQAGFTEDAFRLLTDPAVRAGALDALHATHLRGVERRALWREVGLPAEPLDPAARNFGVLDGTTRAKYRREQGYLRGLLLRGAEVAACDLCGREFPKAYLVAAHIKKREEATDEERLDLANIAMLACSFGCDKLFELGDIAVDQDGTVLTAPSDGPLDPHLRLLAGRVARAFRPETETYFQWHRENTFGRATGG
ncbi:hypothetical protein [Saccharothrix yanglingensis]|uniref:ScoMcrA-like DNA sulfur-binding domain-containing protein n=1 Tax=Saccharothrix yanglingensis TaxID=659496 RepID=A0ABU0XB24_9PSEU|nr:hypothetical protein [Saccharothrix yanglingensis]MDQ2588449.1 hypothetical protein [Saccharothrix yanglingensis]